MNWRDDYRFFENNFVKLRNIHEFVDVFQSSEMRKHAEQKFEQERKQEEREARIADEEIPEQKSKNNVKKLKEINSGADDVTKTLIRQKNEKVFNETLDRNKQKSHNFKTYFPDIT